MLLLAALFFENAASQNCPVRRLAFHGYTFIDMNILPQQKPGGWAPLFMRFERLYESYFTATQTANQDDNLAEWERRFCGEVTKADLRFVLYQAPAEDLELLLTATRSKGLHIPPALQDNTFAEFVFEKKCVETIDYLLFAKQCEPYVTAADAWKPAPRDPEAMRQLALAGKRRFEKTQSAYIRLRYAYQIVRLAHYAGLYEEVQGLCEELLPKIDRKNSRWQESILPWWIAGHRAGALRKLGHNVEASYLYAQVFQHCPGRRASAVQSFYIKNDQEWQDCLRLCESDGERAALYALRAAAADSRAVEEMEKIYELDPGSEYLEVLLVQEMCKVERQLLGVEFNSRKAENKRYYGLPKSYAGKYVIDLQKFVRKCRQEGQVNRPQLWHLAEGYLEMLAGDYYAAEKTFREAESTVSDPLLRQQLIVFRTVLKITAFEKPDVETENFAYQMIKKDELYRKVRSFPDFLKDKMAWLYAQSGQEGKSFLSLHPLASLKPNPQLELLDDLLATTMKTSQTDFERLLMENHPADELLDLKTALLMSRGELEAAFETFRRIPAEKWNDFGQFQPFRETIRECVHCYQTTDTVGLSAYFNKGELLQELLDLEYKSKGDTEGAARHFYRLGLAWYNMSYFGYAWKTMDTFRSGSTWEKLRQGKDGVYSSTTYPLGNRENTDVGRALYYFEKARLLATTPDLAARAAFQAARCEQKMWFVSEGYHPAACRTCIPKLPEESLVNFSRLKEQYAGTEFYQQVVKECKYFAAYAK